MNITVEDEGFCPCVIADEVHLPSATIPFSVPMIIYVTESRPGILGSDGSRIVHENVINDIGACTEAVEIQVHEGCGGS